MYYSAFGLSLRSNRFIPGLPEYEETADVDLSIEWIGESAPDLSLSQAKLWYQSPDRTGDGAPILRAWTLGVGKYWLTYLDEIEYFVDRKSGNVRVFWQESASLEQALSFFFDNVLALFLRWRGITCLHASAVRVGEGAVAFVGGRGRGKSTTAAALGLRGYSLISDDLLPLIKKGEHFFVQPGYARLRLWPESAEALGHESNRLPRLVPEQEKRRLDLLQNGYSFQQQPVMLAAVYLLGERTDDVAAPYVEAVSIQTGVVELVANKYTRFLLDKEMAAEDFDVLTQLAAQIPPRRIVPHSDIDRLPQLCERILAEINYNSS